MTFKSAIVATGSFPLRPPITGLDSPRCVDSTGLLAATEVPRRLVVLGGGIIGCEFASIFQRFGTEVTIVEMLADADPAGGRGRGEGAREAFGKRGIALHLGKQCTKVEDDGSQLTVHFGEGETRRGRPDARLGRPRAARRGDRPRGRSASSSTRARASPPTSTAARPCRTSTRSATAPATGSSRTPRSARARSRPRTRCGHEATIGEPAVPRPIYTDPEIAGVGLTEAQARERHGDDVAVGVFPWVANARAVMQNETVGWVKSIHETNYGELLGLVMVGPHVTDLIEAGTVAIDAESTVETVADGMAAAPDALRGDQGGGSRRARPRDPPAEQEESRCERIVGCTRSTRAVSEREDVPLPLRDLALRLSPSRPLAAEGAARLLAARTGHRLRGCPVRTANLEAGCLRIRVVAATAGQGSRCRAVPVSLRRMSIVNRRNAVLGWLTWLTAKRVLKQKAKAAVPGTVEGDEAPEQGRDRDRHRRRSAVSSGSWRRTSRRRRARRDVRRKLGHGVSLVRAALDGLVPYEPGKPEEEVQRELGLDRVVKLASNEGPWGPFPAALEAIERRARRAEPLSRRRRVLPAARARRAPRRRLRARHHRGRRGRDRSATSRWRRSTPATRSSPAGRPSSATCSTR